MSKRKKGATARRPEPGSAPAPAAQAVPTNGLGDGTGGAYPRELPLYTVRQLASHLQVNRQTIRRMVSMGQIPFVRVGRQIRFDLLAVRSRLDKAT